MNKTPVSILQEMMMKRKIVPNYELTYDGGGTHDNTFTYQVSCDGLVATGTGRCKKDAKHEAAKMMLETIAAHRAYPQLPASPAPSPVKKPLITEVIVSPKRTQFVNAVGALTALCADNNLQPPDYEEVSDIGPPHARIFTYRCRVSTFKEEGIATTKKQAKHEAARKMLEKIQDVVEDLQQSDEVNLYKEEKLLQQSLADEKAADRYATLTKLPQKKINLGVKMENYHRYLKMSFNEGTTRIDILNKVRDFDEFIKEVGNEITEEVVDELRRKICDLLRPLNMAYCSRVMETKFSKKCLVLVEISTNPDIAEVGVADVKHEAEWNVGKTSRKI
ncbi:interferon-inducible double-stranded RNA-dependent protein kinase activator A-like isoform X2 [Belonocnema kinseyi]|uniref:interferon-inducible double-stranded RNA-dependent protein kinase activator A-like isoform X2 n=1 Tax=Belonocnema kinseyi TaxID=2817044 RepID=UPI00143DA326|nr:interferon-inducible double-stranded RNA-dependent protein kinase activator A-like isoform X2 [Belonocnema kinseyi]